MVQLFLAGMREEPETLTRKAFGVHGVGTFTLFEILKTGLLPTGRSTGNEEHIYLYPFSRARPNLPRLGLLAGTTTDTASDEEALRSAASYASVNSEALYKAHLLRLDITSSEGWQIASQLSTIPDGLDDMSDEAFRRAGTTREQAIQVSSLFPESRRGVLLFFGDGIQKDYPPEIGDDGEGDIKLHAPQGLSLDEHCIAITPLTEEDAELVKMLLPLQ